MPRNTSMLWGDGKALQLKITLTDSLPVIWRRILIAPQTTLRELHQIIQVIMPWEESHLHVFYDSENNQYGDLRSEMADLNDESTMTIQQLLSKPRPNLVYEYDFGANWEHSIELEKKVALKAEQGIPCCIDGARSAPPEDCGGIWGYADLLAALKFPEHSAHKEMRAWVGEDFDPAAFDIEQANQALREL